MPSIAPAASLRKAAAAALGLALLFTQASMAADKTPRKVDATEGQLQSLRERMKKLDRELQDDLQRRDQLQTELQAAERELSAAAARKREADAAVARQTRAVAEAEAEHAKAVETWTADRARLQRQLRAAFQSGATSRVRLLLNVDDPRAIERMLVYYDRYAAARGQALRALRTQAAALDIKRRELAAQLAQLEIKRKAQSAAVAALAGARQARGKLLSEVTQKLVGGKDQLKQMRGEEKQLRKLLESLRQAMRDVPRAPALKGALGNYRGKLPWPLRGKILAEFGDSKSVGNMNWNGLWIAAPEGAPVRAVAAGRVAYVGWLQRFGQILILDHDGKYLSLYGHNQAVTREVGETVAAGEVIAAAGSSGGHEQSGLYFEIRRGATPVDPRQWLAPN